MAPEAHSRRTIGQFRAPNRPDLAIRTLYLPGVLVRRWTGTQARRRSVMAETRAPTDVVGRREHPDKSPQAVEEARAEAEAVGAPKPGQRAEVSNLEIVRHYFEIASDRLRLPEDLRTVF